MDNTRLLLQANCDKLLDQYQLNINAVKDLQYTLIQDVLPSVADELALNSVQIVWAKHWLRDTQTIFQLLRRDNFTRSFAIQSIRKNLLWRFKNLWPPDPDTLPSPLSRVYFLPTDVRDPFGRPILVIRAAPLAGGSTDHSSSSEDTNYFSLLIHAMEHFRLRLNELNCNGAAASNQMNQIQTPPVLQYVVLLDVKELSVQTLSVDLITWVLRDLIPRFPGMLAAVFMINASWAHSGMWNVAKRVLPNSAVSRVFFVSEKELVTFFTPFSLPKDYGGYLPSLNSLPSVSPGSTTTSRSSHTAGVTVTPPPEPRPRTSSNSNASPSLSPKSIYLSPTSVLNPFFGYPASFTSSPSPSPSASSLSPHSQPSSSHGPYGSPSHSHLHPHLHLHHGRRRKRDLLRTLAALFWLRWRRSIITTCLSLVALAVAGRWFRNTGRISRTTTTTTIRWLIHSPSGVTLLRDWMSGIM
ncbi:hypothetical protein GYMLUDRAFT_642466 [Collybiopsis luxurians FD-317 M1]|nr:hypothetical protein GYMLUDRAFT_642466 [Collybiopsis luxurians FD-317 M1]